MTRSWDEGAGAVCGVRVWVNLTSQGSSLVCIGAAGLISHTVVQVCIVGGGPGGLQVAASLSELRDTQEAACDSMV